MEAVFLRVEGQEYCTLTIDQPWPTYRFPVPPKPTAVTLRSELDPLPSMIEPDILVFDLVIHDETSAIYRERLQFRNG